MKLLIATAIVTFGAASAFAQSRDLGAQRLILDDGAGHSIRFVTPPGLTNPVIDWVIPVPPVSGMASGFVPEGTATDIYLIWNDALNYWEPGPEAFVMPYSQSGNTASTAFAITNAGTGAAVFASSAGGHGVHGITSVISSAGVIGDNTTGEAVVGRSNSAAGIGAVVGRNDGPGIGVRGFNTDIGIGVLGQSGISGGTGVAGRFENLNAGNTNNTLEVSTNGLGRGITVELPASSGSRGIDVAHAGVGPGVFATTAGNAIWGITSSISSAGVIGDNPFGEAVVGRNNGGNGVGAVVGRNDSSGYGVRGFNTDNGYGVLGQAGISGGTGTAGRFENVNAANTSDALQVITNSAGNAARFTGNVVVNGDLTVSGTVAKGGGSFKIDHPLDPTNRYLYHSFVESPEMKNIYDGVIKLDANGEAVVQLQDWFEVVNMDFRYQLTSIGAPGPGLYISEEVQGNKFKIAGGTPGMKVSWMLTGVRHDPYSRAHRIEVDVPKPANERGTYLHPEAYGQDVPKTVLLMDMQGDVQATAKAATPVDKALTPSALPANIRHESVRTTQPAVNRTVPTASSEGASTPEVKATPKN